MKIHNTIVCHMSEINYNFANGESVRVRTLECLSNRMEDDVPVRNDIAHTKCANFSMKPVI